MLSPTGDKNANYHWQRPCSWQCRRLGGLQMRGQYCKTKIWKIFIFILAKMPSATSLSMPKVLQFMLEFKVWRERTRKEIEILSCENHLSSGIERLWRRGQEDERLPLEGTFGSCDLWRSKSRPLTFLCRTASCLVLIKLCKHPNHEAASVHINPTSFLPPILSAV